MGALGPIDDRPRDAVQTAHALQVRGANLERVFAAAMGRPGCFTRADMIAETELSSPTVGSLLSDLIGLGLLRQRRAHVSGAGRPASLMEFNGQYGFAGAIDVGAAQTRVGIIDLRSTVVAMQSVDTAAAGEPGQLVDRLAQAIREMFDASGLDTDRLLALTVGIPALDAPFTSPQLPAWHLMHLQRGLEEAFSVPVQVDSDVNLAMCAEHRRGAARDCRSAVLIRVSTGLAVSASLMVDGRQLRGDHLRAGHIGLMCMGPPYVGRDSGEDGSLEINVRRRVGRSPGSPDRAADLQRIESLLQAAEAGDAAARGAVLEIARFIGIAAANTAAMVDPSVIVLGGALFSHVPRLGGIVSAVVQSLWPESVDVVVSQLDAEAPLCGGLLVALDAAKQRIRRALLETSAAL
jgi:predicted NBD/HSP70 family sugar kinase